MKIKFVNPTRVELVESAGLSRIWQYTHNKNQDFAVIGSQDKDTKEDRTNELKKLIKELSEKDSHITYRVLKGNYEYDDGSRGTENSFMINNISFEDAMRIMRAINQESIIWKDNDYFGFINYNGEKDGSFSTDSKNMGFNSEDVEAFGSRLDSKHNKGQGFTFKMESVEGALKGRSSIRNLGGDNHLVENNLFTIKVN